MIIVRFVVFVIKCCIVFASTFLPSNSIEYLSRKSLNQLCIAVGVVLPWGFDLDLINDLENTLSKALQACNRCDTVTICDSPNKCTDKRGLKARFVAEAVEKAIRDGPTMSFKIRLENVWPVLEYSCRGQTTKLFSVHRRSRCSRLSRLLF
jgi:hypothetical protein